MLTSKMLRDAFIQSGYNQFFLSDVLDIIEKVDKENMDDGEVGTWLPRRNYTTNYFVCSKCDGVNNIPTPFCPNCGKHMRKRRENGPA